MNGNNKWLELVYRVVIGAVCLFFGMCIPQHDTPSQPSPPQKETPNEQPDIGKILQEILDAIKNRSPSKPSTPERSFDALAATGKISGCTATVLRGESGYLVLTANHCVGRSGYNRITLRDGRSFQIRIAGADRQADIAVYRLETTEKLPIAKVAAANPQPGTRVWHQGYGVHIPGNREEGRIQYHSGKDTCCYLSVSSGDSGSGIFRVDTNELVSVVSRTTSVNRPGEMMGATCESILALLRRIDAGSGGVPPPST